MRRLLLVTAMLLPVLAWSHAMSSAQWRLTQRDAVTWDSHLRLPEDFEGRLLSLQPGWPPHCERLGEPRPQPADEGVVLRWSLRCPAGLGNGDFGLQGFGVRLPDAVLLVEPLRGEPQYAVLSASRPSWSASAPAAPPPVAHYGLLGVDHILLGPDHLLFVLGLWALWRRSGARPLRLLGTLTAFTAAHSITLAGAALGGWSLPAGAVEACIAASILLLAVELAGDGGGPAERWPARVAFGFGLLHGFGFAGALAETGLPDGAQGWALAAFNLGVEAGQIAFVLVLFVLARLARPLLRFSPVALAAYGAIAAAWLIERSAAVFTGAGA